MNTVTIQTLEGTEHVVSEGALHALQAGLRGQLAFPGDPGYEEARSLWNGMIDKHPALVVRCAGTADVMAAVNLARENDLLVSVRGGGHNIAGSAVSDGGLMIDLSPMKGIRVDPETRRVWVQPGTVWGDVDRETQPFGLAVPSGIISTTGVAGLTLGGGFGWLSRKWGYTADRLRAADVVTADGRYLTASETENPDLFWAIRGGGGNFGVVTNFEFEAVPVGPTVMAGIVFHPFEKVQEVIQLFREVTSTAPDELTCLLVIRTAPPAPFIPEEYHGKRIAGIAVMYSGPVEDAEPYVRPIKEFGSPIVDLIQPKPFIAHQTFLDSGQPHGRHYYWKSDFITGINEQLSDAVVENWEHVTSPFSSTLSMHVGGAAKRVPAGATAVGFRNADYVMVVQGAWDDPSTRDEHISWVRRFFEDVRPHSSGTTYINFLNEDDGQDRTLQAYVPTTFQRLVEVKNRYDPGNLFQLNKNIHPTVKTERAAEAIPASD